MRALLDSYGRLAARRPGRLLVGWLVLAVAVLAAWTAVGTSTDDAVSIPGSDSAAAQDLQASRFPASALGNGTLIFTSPGEPVTSPGLSSALAAALRAVGEVPHVSGVTSPLPQEAGAPTPRVSRDGRTAYAQVYLDEPSGALDQPLVDALLAAASPAREAGLTVLPGGQLARAAADPAGHTSELVGVGVAALVLLVALGTAVAMALPILSALGGLVLGLAVIGLLSQLGAVPGTATTVATMISLGVGIDYALFVVVRYRGLVAEGQPHEAALGTALATAGASVLFAGATVAVGLGGLLLAGLPLLVALGWTAAVGVAVAVLVALGLLPALLGLLGPGLGRAALPRRRPPVPGHGAWRALGARTVRRPWVSLVGALLVMGVFVAPVAGMSLGQQDDGDDAPATATRIAYDLLGTAFGPGVDGPLLVVADLPPGRAGAAAAPVAGALAEVPGVAAVQGPQMSRDGTAALWQVVPATAPSDPATGDLVTTLREDVVPPLETSGAVLHVGGQTAAEIDFTGRVAERLPLVLAVVIAISVVLLVVLFRSLVVPLTAAVMNVLSVGAAYGILTFIFQDGHGVGLLGLDGPVPLESYVPLMLFAILFGLSTDYEIFLVSSIAERWHATHDDRASVVSGLGTAGRVVTAAALIMFSVFASFVGQDDPVIKMFGVGLAAAVLLDALVVRGFLVPTLMVLLGRSNWWLPPALDRLLPRLDPESPPPPVEAGVAGDLLAG